jgi:hypothetical protein
MNAVKFYKSGNARVIVDQDQKGVYRVSVWLASGLSEQPIKYPGGGVAYDHPEIVSRTLKALVLRGFRWIERTTGGDYMDQFTKKGN